VSLYTELLVAALGGAPEPDHGSTAGGALAELLRRRIQLDEVAASSTPAGWAPDAVAGQLAYDLALVELARRLGIDFDVRRFDRPQEERARLEGALGARGIHLDVLSGETEAEPAD